MKTTNSVKKFMLFLIIIFSAGIINSQIESSFGKTEQVSESVIRRQVEFPSENETLRGWLYLPADIKPGEKLPGIVTANALTGVKEINLPEYAERFAAVGFVTIIFDYRYWGESTGNPHYHVAPMEFRTDIQSALTYLTQQPEVDAERIGGWGISMGGGHMLFLATWEPRFKTIVATSTGISKSTEEAPVSEDEAKLRYNQLKEAAESEREGRANANIQTLQAWCTQPEEGCLLPVKEAYDFYENARKTLAPQFENKITSTSLQNMIADNSVFAIHLAKAPILIIQPDRDVVPVEDVLFYFKRAPEPKRLVMPGGLHTSTYVGGENLEMAATEAIYWFKKYLVSK
jgi:fermentation-respiration switch protein FrsA (DUF1100 family)